MKYMSLLSLAMLTVFHPPSSEIMLGQVPSVDKPDKNNYATWKKQGWWRVVNGVEKNVDVLLCLGGTCEE